MGKGPIASIGFSVWLKNGLDGSVFYAGRVLDGMTTRDRRTVVTPERLAELSGEIEALLRRPFRRELARILGCAPTNAAIVRFSKRFPDRWGQLVAIFGRLSGYSEKVEVEASLAHQINNLSDAEVISRLEAIESELAKQSRALPPVDASEVIDNAR